jgi:hypothetical protein
VQKYTNLHDVPLSLAVFLATDNYDYESDTISATTFLKPVRQLILANRVPAEENLVDVIQVIKSRKGTAIHDAIERAWLDNPQAALKALGYPKRMISNIKINPDPSTVTEDDIPIYMEQRFYKKVLGYNVSGKFDFVLDGRLEDFKSTSTFTWSNKGKELDYSIQGSIYRWLAPHIITEDELFIQFLFMDWKPNLAKAGSNYPDRPIKTKVIQLMSYEQTEQFIRNKIMEIEKYKNYPEIDLPLCSDVDLWRTETQYKWFSKATNKRAQKTFGNDKAAAYRHLSEKSGQGVIREVPGEVKACAYCAAAPLCSQRQNLIANGSFKP